MTINEKKAQATKSQTPRVQISQTIPVGNIKHDPHPSNQNKPPAHIAIIMDGNGRWAQNRSLPRIEGHRRGAHTAMSIIKAAGKHNIKYLSLYCFSVENWMRPENEIEDLFELFRYFSDLYISKLTAMGVRIKFIGSQEGLAETLRVRMQKGEEKTKNNTKLTLIIAINYGGQQEIIRAVQRIIRESGDKKINPDDITAERIRQHLDTAEYPDPDLIIRTSGEQRLSNFLLWQSAYCEFMFLDTLWPDFTETHFQDALQSYMKRERRFGGLKQ